MNILLSSDKSSLSAHCFINYSSITEIFKIAFSLFNGEG